MIEISEKAEKSRTTEKKQKNPQKAEFFC